MITPSQAQEMVERLERNKKRCVIEPSEWDGKPEVDKESILHDQIIRHCRAQGWYFVHSRTDKRTTNQIGTPDFVIATFNDVYFVEVKRKGNKPSMEQMAVGVMLNHLRKNHRFCYDFDEFLDFVK